MERQSETIADIIAEKRRRAADIRQNLSTVPIRRDEQLAEAECLEDEADRLEAAYKRARVNCAKLREALEKSIVKLSEIYHQTDLDGLMVVIDSLRAALAAPSRNCDRFGSCIQARAEWWKTEVLPRVEEVIGGAKPFAEWLFAPATEKEGGAK